MFSTSSQPIEEMWARYWDEEWWRKYYEEDLGRLYKAAARILAMREELSKMLAGKTLAQILEEPDQNKKEMYLKILLGGYDMKNNLPKPKSLSNFYRWILGIGVYELEDYYSFFKLADFKTVAREIHITTRESGFIKDVKDVSDRLETIYKTIYPRTKLKLPEMESVEVKDVKDPVEAVVEFFNAARALLPLYNRVSFFIQSLRSIPKFYAKMVYGEKLFDKEVQAILNKWGANMVKMVELKALGALAEESSIWGLSENSVAAMILQLLIKIYHMTHPYYNPDINYKYKKAGELLREYMDLKEEVGPYCKTYLELVKSKVKTIVDSIGEGEREMLLKFFNCFKEHYYSITIYIADRGIKYYHHGENFLPWGTFVGVLALPFFTGFAFLERGGGDSLKLQLGYWCGNSWIV